MQSSLLRFLQRREQEGPPGKKRSSSGEDSGGAQKRPKLGASRKRDSLEKLRQFARQGEAPTSIDTASEKLSLNRSPNDFENQIDGNVQVPEPDNMIVDGDKQSDSDITESHSSDSFSRSQFYSSDSFSRSQSHSRATNKGSPQQSLSSSGSTSGRAGISTPTSKAYTPLEQQFIAIKADYPDALLFVECGYKYRFFGEDAEIASKVLNIGCFPDHNFMVASIPVHRLNVHLRRLVAAGYKVGVVKQMETAALKAASDKKSGPFSRQLTGLYTRTTLLGPDVESRRPLYACGGESVRRDGGVEEEEEDEGLYLMCLCEGRRGSGGGSAREGNEIAIGFLAVQPSAGNMVYDEFVDNMASFSQLEMRLSHLHPAELLYPNGTPKALEESLLQWKRYSGTQGLRFEKLPEEWFDYNMAFPTVTNFYSVPRDKTSENYDAARMAEALQVSIHLPPSALCCLGALINHLKAFKLQRVLTLTSNLKEFSTSSHSMRLTSKTLENLEIFKNLSDRGEKGTLFWVLNHTRTLFGRRKLRNWVSYPLRSVKRVSERQEAVRELSSSETPSLSLLKEAVTKLPDLEKMLCSAYHKKCSPSEFYSMVSALVRVQRQLHSFSEMALDDLHSGLVQQVVKEVPTLLTDAHQLMDALHEKSAREGTYETLFTQPEKFPEVIKEKKAIEELQRKLLDFRKQFRQTLGSPSLDYVTVSGIQYLVEVKNSEVHRVPADWTRISGTKHVTRFHPSYVLEAVKLLAQHREQLKINAKAAWNDFLTDFSEHYGSYKRAVDLLATLDCLLSLAKVAKMHGYVCPSVVEEAVVRIEGGRHPIIDLLLGEGEQYVPNNTEMSISELCTMIITGPNMGGKSSYIKQVALLCIMAQVGSFVPAASATLGVLDAVYTRMGASDSLYTGKSTFMVELLEASEIMRLATARSLVILDELGRGTSTHDGTAVAYATLTYFIEEVKCLTLFVTHYPLLGELETKHPGAMGNFHMAYVEAEESSEDYEKIVFLFQLEKGQAGGSYGLNVAALAGLDRNILRVAGRKSKEMEMATTLDESSGMEGTLDRSKIQAFRKTMELVDSEEYGRESLTELRILISDSL